MTAVEQFLKDPEHVRLYQQEQLLLNVTEHMCKIMKEDGVTRSQLAKRLGVHKSRITRVLNGENSLTLSTIADIFTALGRKAVFQTESIHGRLSPVPEQ